MSEPRRRIPIGECLPGVEIPELPDGWVPLEAIVVIKGLDEDGDALWASRYTEGLTTIECVGALTAMLDLERRRAVAMYEPDDVEDD